MPGASNNHNVEKLSVTLDLKSPEGKALLGRLIAQSDAVTENFSAHVMERLGMQADGDFDHPRLPEAHPLRRHLLYRRAAPPGP